MEFIICQTFVSIVHRKDFAEGYSRTLYRAIFCIRYSLNYEEVQLCLVWFIFSLILISNVWNMFCFLLQ